MELPILSKLKEGVQFDFETLAENIEQVDQYWDWWWEDKYEAGKISRPEIISNDDPVLIETINKDKVDLAQYPEFWNDLLVEKVTFNKLTRWEQLSRQVYRNFVLRMLHAYSIKLSEHPKIVFAGGGYGSGKTVTLNRLSQCGTLPLKLQHQVGVDYFKLLMPEFSLIQAVSDGRASFTVQKECKKLADQLFENLVQDGRSFIWDSSMSDKSETLTKIQLAKRHGYELDMIAVLAPVEVAIDQAMHRAKQTRRFPHKDALPNSHINFRKAFMEYVPLFERITVFANLRDGCDIPVVLADKKHEKELDIKDQRLFNALMGT